MTGRRSGLGVDSYSLKQTEHSPGSPVRQTSRRLRSRAGVRGWRDSQDQAELDAIAAYNEEDCRATVASATGCSRFARPRLASSPLPVASPSGTRRSARPRRNGAAPPELINGAPVEVQARGWPASYLSITAARSDLAGGGTSPARDGRDDLIDDGEALAGLDAPGEPPDAGRPHYAYDAALSGAGPQDRRRALIDPATGRASMSRGRRRGAARHDQARQGSRTTSRCRRR